MITGYITPNPKENTHAKTGTSIAVFVLATTLLVFCKIGLAGGFYWYIVLLIILGLVISIGALVLQIRWLVRKPTT